MEVSQYDTSINGKPQVYIIRPNASVENKSIALEAHARWAEDVGERIQTLIVSPTPEAT
jgi:hypothetical protein